MNKIELQVCRHRLEGIADEMGNVLQRTAFSPNIKERRDFSCAIVDTNGALVAQAAHIPVHLGAIPTTMKHFLTEIDPVPNTGYLLNDPYKGGTHLPDLSYIEAWAVDGDILGFVINRAHHTDIGGKTAGSMSASTHIDQEGFRTGPVKISVDGSLKPDCVDELLDKSRTPEERISDLEAQIASARRGLDRLTEFRTGIDVSCQHVFDELRRYSNKFMTERIRTIPNGVYSDSVKMDDDGVSEDPVKLQLSIDIDNSEMLFDFTNSAHQVEGNINCPRAVVTSCVYYVLRSLLPDSTPMNQGVFEPVDVITEHGSIVDVEYPGAVAGGNVETSQRIVDLVLLCLSRPLKSDIPSASQGTMNNLSIGWEQDSEILTYYETLGGGAGGGPKYDGISARQVHMTNTQNTPIEEFERRFPVLVEKLLVREGSGGDGKKLGGDGLIKTWRALDDVTVSILSERRRFSPYGLHGGSDGSPGYNLLKKNGEVTELDSKVTVDLEQGDRLRVETPGGGGWGRSNN